jgi:hypothetical protein
VVILYKNENKKAKIINGAWNFAIDNSKQTNAKEVEYKAVNNKSRVQILSAKASVTSFNLSFAIDVTPDNSRLLEVQEIKLIGEKGEVYNCNVYNVEMNGGKAIITTNFISSSNHALALMFNKCMILLVLCQWAENG